MNRHERRAQERLAKRKLDGSNRIIAVYEAGHAVAKMLAVNELGYGLESAIERIEMVLPKSSFSHFPKVPLEQQNTPVI